MTIRSKSMLPKKILTALYRKDYKTLKRSLNKDTVNLTDEEGGLTLLMLAVADSDADPEMVQFLIDNGADVNLADSAGYTALHLAARDLRKDLVLVLLEAGAELVPGHELPKRKQKGVQQGKASAVAGPFMEHPSGADYESVVEAMADAITRLRALPNWAKWITFQAQGMGPREDSYHFADILMLHERIKLRKSVAIDLAWVARRARAPLAYLSEVGRNTYSLGNANPRQAARVLDVIFRHYLGIRPHPDDDGDVDLEEDDYAVGAEW